MSKKSRTLPRIVGTGRGPRSREHAASSATIAIYSVKGGVGKTTLAANLAWCSAAGSGHRTLLWDLDAAGGAGFLLGVAAEQPQGAAALFSNEREPRNLVQPTDFPGLDLLPADESLRSLDSQLLRIGKRKRLARLAEELSRDYDRILLDCPPVMNEVSAQVIRAADLVIVPLPPSPLSARALDMVVREIAVSAKRTPPILPVLSMLDLRRSLHRQAREANPGWPAIPYASAVELCAVRQCPVGAFDPRSPAAERFRFLWDAIERKLEER